MEDRGKCSYSYSYCIPSTSSASHHGHGRLCPPDDHAVGDISKLPAAPCPHQACASDYSVITYDPSSKGSMAYINSNKPQPS